MIHQIYYKEEQKKRCTFSPYFNERCSVYFENAVILDKIDDAPKSLADVFFGVLPWNVAQKISRMRLMPTPFRNILSEKEDALYEPVKNVLFLMKHIPHNPVSAATKIHPRFEEFWIELMRELRLDPKDNQEWRHIIYCNFFIAKRSLYKRYVDELLRPAVRIMELMPLLYVNSRYPKQITEELAIQTGYNHYTYHTFLCERLFSYWVNFMY